MLIPEKFIEQYNGFIVDYDKVYGAQCVDAYKVFCSWMDYPVKPTLTGYADGYWWDRNVQDYGTYFDFITNPKQLHEGDWLFWAYGSKSCPMSHVGMFVGYVNASKTVGRIFSENQGTFRGFSTVNINLDICGAFRPKVWNDKTQVTEFVTLLYKNILGRKPDQPGLNGWVNALVSGQSAKNVVSAFFNSKEYKEKKTSNEQFVIDCYKGYLNRKPDKSGNKNWMDKLNRGVARSVIMNDFANSQEFKKILNKYGLT